MARYKNVEWGFPEKVQTYEQAAVAVLMDIRDELRAIRLLLDCQNCKNIPAILRAIQTNTDKKKRKAVAR